ncbi:transposase [Actinomadura rudentiformis]|uniref:Transposase n=1 Tax=Actinomadura rudentiformis TaxID=359158 RepID=A0A6H9Y839_9ACTN|nr:transposase [Actinomadura rudentiformis]
MMCGVVRGGELTEPAWVRLESLLPQMDGRGRPWRDHSQVINGTWWRLRTGAPWRISLNGAGLGRPATNDGNAGTRTEPGPGCCRRSRPRTMQSAAWNGAPDRHAPDQYAPDRHALGQWVPGQCASGQKGYERRTTRQRAWPGMRNAPPGRGVSFG